MSRQNDAYNSENFYEKPYIIPFVSLHGYPEIAENIHQLLIARDIFNDK